MKVFIIVSIIIILLLILKRNIRFALPTAKATHLMVISIDALRSQDLDFLKTLPNFRKILEKASYSSVKSIYPTLTYPCHTTIVTGNYPINHGIENNLKLVPEEEKPSWHWYSEDVKCNTLYDEAKKHKLKVGSIFWPVMAKAKVDYNLAEIWPMDKSETQKSISLKTGTKPFILDAFLRYGKLLDGTKQPNLDNFSTKTASLMIKSRKPNLMLLHLIDVDNSRHKYGTTSKEAYEALKRQDVRIGEIIETTKSAGIYDDTAFVILGDHSFLDIEQKINLNYLFIKEGLITLDSSGKLVDWDVYALSCGGSCQIKIKNENDSSIKDKVELLLKNLYEENNSPFENIFFKSDLKTRGVSSFYDYMIECRKGFCFSSSIKATKLIEPLNYDNGEYRGNHGFDPNKDDYETLFITFGKGIKENVVLDGINLVDEGPTLAHILGLDLGETDGHVIEEFFQ